jgi:hypothetical protein
VVASARPRSDSVSAHVWAQACSEAGAAARSRGGNTRAICTVATGGDEVDECRCQGRTHGAATPTRAALRRGQDGALSTPSAPPARQAV